MRVAPKPGALKTGALGAWAGDDSRGTSDAARRGRGLAQPRAPEKDRSATTHAKELEVGIAIARAV